MVFTIKSDRSITDERITQLIDILKMSQCPNESMLNSFDDFTSFKDDVIMFGTGEGFNYQLEI